MKKVLCFVCVCVMIMLTTVTSSAADDAKFKLKLVSETDTQAVVSLDYEGGASFAAIDFTVEPNKDKAEVTKIEDGKGMLSFKMQTQLVISQPNVKNGQGLVSAAMMPGYRNVDGEDLFVITLKKLTKEALTADDIKIVFSNCQDSSTNNINPVVTYELSSGFTAEESTSNVSATQTSDTQTDKAEEDISENSQSLTEAASADNENAQEQTDESAENEKGSNKTVIIVVCVISAVAVGGGAAVAYVFIKKKKDSESPEKESKED